MTVFLEPVVDTVEKLTTALHCWYSYQRKLAILVDSADMFKPKKIEGFRFRPIFGTLLSGEPAKEDESRLFLRQLQSELLHSFLQQGFETLRVPFVLEAGDVIVGKTDEVCLALEPFLAPFLEPEVKYIMQVDVRQNRTNRPALRAPFLIASNDSVLHNTRF